MRQKTITDRQGAFLVH